MRAVDGVTREVGAARERASGGVDDARDEAKVPSFGADSDEAARVKRDDAARGYEMMPPTVTE
jgi:hypothetical protein